MKLVTPKVIRHRNVPMITLNVAFKDVRDYMIVSLGMCGTIAWMARVRDSVEQDRRNNGLNTC